MNLPKFAWLPPLICQQIKARLCAMLPVMIRYDQLHHIVLRDDLQYIIEDALCVIDIPEYGARLYGSHTMAINPRRLDLLDPLRSDLERSPDARDPFDFDEMKRVVDLYGRLVLDVRPRGFSTGAATALPGLRPWMTNYSVGR